MFIFSGYEVDGIHEASDPVEAVKKAEAIFIGEPSSNTFLLCSLIFFLYQYFLWFNLLLVSPQCKLEFKLSVFALQEEETLSGC